MIRGFVNYGDHPILDDPYIKRLALVQKVLAPAQSILFVSFVIIFIAMLIAK